MNYSRHSRHCNLSRYTLAILGVVLATFLAGLLFSSKTFAAEPQNPVNLYIFWGQGCPHCERAKSVLEPYAEERDNITYKNYEIYYSPSNQQKMQAVGEALEIDASGVPLIVVGDTSYIGFSSTTGDAIKRRLDYCSTHICPDRVAAIVSGAEASPISPPGEQNEQPAHQSPEASSAEKPAEKYIDLPLLGRINIAQYSLPVLTIIIGLLDGFNPCAMWALLFIITLLIGMNDRKKMWLYGTAFIVTSAIVYFVFMAAWLNLFLFIGHIVWIRLLIGGLAVAVGTYYLRDWYRHKTGCAITGNERRQAVFIKMREIIKEKSVLVGLGGIMLLAAMVNIVELACSAGLPVLYTGILSSAGLETWQYYAYMLLYILFFMLDDLIVFAIAMLTFKVVGIESKYTRAVRLVGGVIMLLIGLLLIFAPQVLMFG